ncbi:Nodule Cysteine-Rich (NCR) secreted peptide [Medicago truncatula]|uniref:Nodule Cysteine-Rich (NCR) secreted peptide n=2 Tax=Medicago truncatula TaxID=3880 RepID=A0A072VJQ8_MEDTR|nr:Nodule Cysteine-Rich (NCR) secreted peptide [Medicago truncatula]
MSYGSNYSPTPFPCLTDKDCTRRKGFSVTCRKGFCVEFKHF